MKRWFQKNIAQVIAIKLLILNSQKKKKNPFQIKGNANTSPFPFPRHSRTSGSYVKQIGFERSRNFNFTLEFRHSANANSLQIEFNIYENNKYVRSAYFKCAFFILIQEAFIFKFFKQNWLICNWCHFVWVRKITYFISCLGFNV